MKNMCVTSSTVLTTQYSVLHATRLRTIFNPHNDCLVRATNEFQLKLNTLHCLVPSHRSAARFHFNETPKLFELLEKAAEQTAATHTHPPPPQNKAPIVYIIIIIILKLRINCKVYPSHRFTHQPDLVN